MNPVRAEGKIVRYDMIPIMEQEFGDFERECWEIFEQQYAKKCPKECLQCAKEQLIWELEHVKKYHRTTVFVIGREIARITEGSYWIKGHMASSIIAFLLGISHVDPIKNTLFKEAVWGLRGNRYPQLIFCELEKEKVKLIEDHIRQISGVGDVIRHGKENEVVLYIVPEGCQVKAYRQMEEKELEDAVWSIIFRWNEKLPDNSCSFEEEFNNMLERGVQREEAYTSAMKNIKMKGLRYQADYLEECHFWNKRNTEGN